MVYADETILKMRKEKEQQQYQTLEQGRCVQGNILEFNRQSILDKFSLLFLDEWKQMPPELARIKYPSEFRPQCIYTSQDLSVNMGFNIFSPAQPIGDLEKFTKRILETMFKESPNLIFIKSRELEKVNGHWFAYRSHAMDSDLFNQLLIMEIDQMVLMSNFNCLYQYGEEWEETVVMMWESIEELKEEVHKR